MNIGIDFGTTFSVAAVMNENNTVVVVESSEGGKLTPSVVLFEGNDVIVGEVAKESSILEPGNTVEFIKDHMGEQEYNLHIGEKSFSPEEISAFILRKIKRDIEKYVGEKISEAVITVPAYFSDAQRKATMDAAYMADFLKVDLINEPTAACISFIKLNNIKSGIILVYDLGGGTFDVTLLRVENSNIEVISSDGMRNLGGHFFDSYITNYVIEFIEDKHDVDLFDEEYIDFLQEISKKAEACKVQLSTKQSAKIILKYNNIREKIDISRELFESMIQDSFNNTKRVMEDLLANASLEWDDIQYVLLVGGSSRVPYIVKKMEECAKDKIMFNINPDEAVAVGACYYSSMRSSGNTIVKDVSSHGLGIKTSDKSGKKYINNVVFPKHQTIPSRKSRTFFISSDNQKSFILEVTEGDDSELEYVTIIGSFEIDLMGKYKANTPVEIEMFVDSNQIIYVYCRIGEELLEEVQIDRSYGFTDDELTHRKDLISSFEVE